MSAPEATGEIARMEKVSDTPRPTTAVETAPKADPTNSSAESNPKQGLFAPAKPSYIPPHFSD